MAKILPKVARWEPSETLGVRYRFYWATCKPVPHNLEYADVGTVTEIRLPADIPTFPRIAGKIVLGVSAVVQSGVESEVTTTIADIDFTIPATPRNLKVED